MVLASTTLVPKAHPDCKLQKEGAKIGVKKGKLNFQLMNLKMELEFGASIWGKEKRMPSRSQQI